MQQRLEFINLAKGIFMPIFFILSGIFFSAKTPFKEWIATCFVCLCYFVIIPSAKQICFINELL